MEKYIDIIFFAVVAGIILYRLKDVLGEKTGFQGKEDSPQENEAPVHRADSAENPVVTPFPTKHFTSSQDTPNASAQKGLDQINKADPSFNKEHFLAGASQALQTILAAYAKGEKETLRELVSRDVFKIFNVSIDARRRAKQTLESTFERLLSTEILKATLDKKNATIQIKFVSERTDVLYDKKGTILQGNPDTINKCIDIWTFERKITDANPNWTLTSTSTEKNA